MIFFYPCFFKTTIALKRRPIFKKKKKNSANGNRFLQFFQTLIWMEAVQWNRTFQRILHSGKWKQIFNKLQTLCFYLELFLAGGHHSRNLWKTIFFHFFNSYLWKQFCRLVEKYFFIECFIPSSGNGWIFCLVFFYSEQIFTSGNHYLNCGKAILYRVSSSLLLKTICYSCFLDIPANESIFFCAKETYLFNESFFLACAIRSFV